MKKNILYLVLVTTLIILGEGCTYKNIIIPAVSLYDDYVDCNEEYVVKMSETDNGDVVDVVKEGKLVSQLKCDIYGIEPRFVAVGQNGYYLLDWEEGTMFVVGFDSEIIAKKIIPEDVNGISCKNGYVFLGKFPARYVDGINADYFLEEEYVMEDIQPISEIDINTLDFTFYRSDEGYSNEPSLDGHEKIYEKEKIQAKTLLNKGEEYNMLADRLQDEDMCHVVEYQKGYNIYGWVNCYNDSYSEALANKSQPLLSSITKGIAYKINAQNRKGEVIREGEEGILFSAENKILFIENDGRVFCYYIKQKENRELAQIKPLYQEQPHIYFKKDILMWYDENDKANIVRY
ncbi:MAG: hypothetical protein NC293_13285 [Roseburia sp.]|nr:hypothetical protein [Roseburia sp.]